MVKKKKKQRFQFVSYNRCTVNRILYHTRIHHYSKACEIVLYNTEILNYNV